MALTTGIFVAIAGGLVSLFVRSSPEPYDYLPDGAQEAGNTNEPSAPNIHRVVPKILDSLEPKALLFRMLLKQRHFG